MPRLKKIVVRDYRNIELQEIDFCPNVNCISGGNGEGKTSLLDAIWYLSMAKSSLSPTDSFCFRHGTSSFAISGLYTMENGTLERFSVQVGRKGAEVGEKKFKRNDSTYKKVSEHIGTLPIVMVSPADVTMVSDTGEERRKFVNSVLSQMQPQYLTAVQQYNRYLLQRNRLLKSGMNDESLLETFDERLSELSEPIFRSREEFVEKLTPTVQEFYNEISGGKESVGIEYRSCLKKESLRDTLRSHRDQDLLLKYTTAGLQRDDFLFTMDSYPIRRIGSQGQQKSFLVALKFAQYSIMKKDRGVPPMLLLDDLFDKLDMDRVGNLLQMVAGNDFGQIFLTDSNKVRISSIVDALTTERTYYEASGGAFSKADG